MFDWLLIKFKFFQFVFFFPCFSQLWQQCPPSLLPSPWPLVPDSATSAMSTPCSCAMKPRTENIAKPDTKLVPLLRPPSSKQSLCHTYVMEVVNEHRWNRSSHFLFTQPSLIRDCGLYFSPGRPSLRKQSSPVAVVLVFVVAPQGRHGSQTNGVGEENLSSCINPHLRSQRKRVQIGQGYSTFCFLNLGTSFLRAANEK